MDPATNKLAKVVESLHSMVESYDILMGVMKGNEVASGVVYGAFVFTIQQARKTLNEIYNDPEYYRKVEPKGLICKAAIIFNDKVVTGWRHAFIRNAIILESDPSKEDMSAAMHDDFSCGFVTENGRFLTRTQAMAYGIHIGQITKIIGGTLTSEDLWDVDGKKHA